jgi:hypothetical protein
MEKEKWIQKIGGIEVHISHTSGIYSLAFLMEYGWYEEIEKIVDQIQKDALKDLKQELFTFFRWFQWNGEKYMDKPIEEMIKVYLEERKSGDVLGKIKKQIKLEKDKNEGA